MGWPDCLSLESGAGTVEVNLMRNPKKQDDGKHDRKEDESKAGLLYQFLDQWYIFTFVKWQH